MIHERVRRAHRRRCNDSRKTLISSLRILPAMVVFALLLGLAADAAAYRSDTRQALTFLAAKRFNRCVEGTDVPRLTALQVRNLVRGNLREAERNGDRFYLAWQRRVDEMRRANGQQLDQPGCYQAALDGTRTAQGGSGTRH